MVQGGQIRKKYPSDLTGEPWAIVEPLNPPTKRRPRGGRPRKGHMLEVLHTLLYLNRSGCQWDMLPLDLLPKSTVYDYFGRWPARAAPAPWPARPSPDRALPGKAADQSHTTPDLA